jgi:very-short-patch-repair endonuclease
MATPGEQDLLEVVHRLAKRQHRVVGRGQLAELGMTAGAIKWWVRSGRLHPLHRGVYAVGHREVTRLGAYLAAVFACGPEAVLSHESAAALWGLRRDRPALPIEVSAPGQRRRGGLRVHRRRLAPGERTFRLGVPVAAPALTLVDLAARLDRAGLERAVGEADRLGLVDPERLRRQVARMPARPGLSAMAKTLDRHTFRLTRSELERRFLGLARRAGLPAPETCVTVNGYEVDFFWPALGLVVETDGLRYHRTAAQQAADRLRDQTHQAAGLVPLRFTHWQVSHDRRWVEDTLRRVAQRFHSMRPS